MRIVLTVAMIIGSSALLHAETQHHRAYLPPHAESFMGLAANPRLSAPLDRSLGLCNAGSCTLTGGPSGGPNQS